MTNTPITSKECASISGEGSELMMELFNRIPIEALKAVPESIAKRIGSFMVDDGYRFVFARWYLQADPKQPEELERLRATVERLQGRLDWLEKGIKPEVRVPETPPAPSKEGSCSGGLGCCNPHGDYPQCGCAGKIERLMRENATLRSVCKLLRGLNEDPEHEANVAKRIAHETTGKLMPCWCPYCGEPHGVHRSETDPRAPPKASARLCGFCGSDPAQGSPRASGECLAENGKGGA